MRGGEIIGKLCQYKQCHISFSSKFSGWRVSLVLIKVIEFLIKLYLKMVNGKKTYLQRKVQHYMTSVLLVSELLGESNSYTIISMRTDLEKEKKDVRMR